MIAVTRQNVTIRQRGESWQRLVDLVDESRPNGMTQAPPDGRMVRVVEWLSEPTRKRDANGPYVEWDAVVEELPNG